MTQLLHAPAGALPFPRSLVDRDHDRLARYREFLDISQGRKGATVQLGGDHRQIHLHYNSGPDARRS